MILACCMPSAVWAEYRVFSLHIFDPALKVTRQVETTLDPLQYAGIYPLKTGEQISYVDSWLCRGNTGLKGYCDNPHVALDTPSGLDRNPASPPQSPEVPK